MTSNVNQCHSSFMAWWSCQCVERCTLLTFLTRQGYSMILIILHTHTKILCLWSVSSIMAWDTHTVTHRVISTEYWCIAIIALKFELSTHNTHWHNNIQREKYSPFYPCLILYATGNLLINSLNSTVKVPNHIYCVPQCTIPIQYWPILKFFKKHVNKADK